MFENENLHSKCTTVLDYLHDEVNQFVMNHTQTIYIHAKDEKKKIINVIYYYIYTYIYLNTILLIK